MTEKKENPPPNPEKTKDQTPDNPSSSSASNATEEFSYQNLSLPHEKPGDTTPETPVPSTALDVTKEQSKPQEISLSPFNLTASKQLKHKSPKKFMVDVDILINKWNMKSEEIPCLVGENIPSSNSDENYGSFDNIKSLSPARQNLIHKPWIKAVRGTLHFKDKLDEATMESWLADGSDDSLTNSNSDYMSHFLNPDDEFEEFQENPNIFNPNNAGTNEKILDLLTGDDYAKEDSNPCTQPICVNQNYTVDGKSKEEAKKIIHDFQIDSIEKCVRETVEHLLLQLSPENPPSLSSRKDSKKEAVKETVFKKFDADHCGNNTNCFNTKCLCDHSSIKDIGMKLIDRRVTCGFGLDDYDDNLPKCESSASANIAVDNEIKEDNQGDVYFLISKIESLTMNTQNEANSGNCENVSNVSTDCPPEAKTEITEEDPIQDSIISEASKAVFGEYGETPDKSEALAKHKKRVTFADELEKKSQDKESVMIKQNTGCGEVQEAQQEPLTSALPLLSEVNPSREVNSALPLVREVNTMRDDENNINSLNNGEHITMPRPETPRAEFVPSEANEDLVSKTQRKSPLMVNVQEKTADEEKVIEKPAGKISRLYKSMKKKIGKIL